MGALSQQSPLRLMEGVMPDRTRAERDALAAYWMPWSEWWIRPGAGPPKMPIPINPFSSGYGRRTSIDDLGNKAAGSGTGLDVRLPSIWNHANSEMRFPCLTTLPLQLEIRAAGAYLSLNTSIFFRPGFGKSASTSCTTGYLSGQPWLWPCGKIRRSLSSVRFGKAGLAAT